MDMGTKYILKIVIVLLCGLMSLTSCDDDNVPSLVTTTVSVEQILGGWKISETKAYVDINWKYQVQVSSLGLKGKMDDAFDEKAKDGSIFFKDKMAYFLRDGFVRDSSSYHMEDYIIYYDNANLIGFYAPYMYVKFEENRLVLYLRRKETLNLLEEDGSLSGWMGTIRDVVDDAQCEIRMDKEYLPIYDEL